MKKAVKPHHGKETHVILDNLSTHTTPEVKAWLASNPHVHFPLHPSRESRFIRIGPAIPIISG